MSFDSTNFKNPLSAVENVVECFYVESKKILYAQNAINFRLSLFVFFWVSRQPGGRPANRSVRNVGARVLQVALHCSVYSRRRHLHYSDNVVNRQ